MTDTSKWFGPVGSSLGGLLYINVSPLHTQTRARLSLALTIRCTPIPTRRHTFTNPQPTHPQYGMPSFLVSRISNILREHGRISSPHAASISFKTIPIFAPYHHYCTLPSFVHIIIVLFQTNEFRSCCLSVDLSIAVFVTVTFSELCPCPLSFPLLSLVYYYYLQKKKACGRDPAHTAAQIARALADIIPELNSVLPKDVLATSAQVSNFLNLGFKILCYQLF